MHVQTISHRAKTLCIFLQIYNEEVLLAEMIYMILNSNSIFVAIVRSIWSYMDIYCITLITLLYIYKEIVNMAQSPVLRVNNISKSLMSSSECTDEFF